MDDVSDHNASLDALQSERDIAIHLESELDENFRLAVRACENKRRGNHAAFTRAVKNLQKIKRHMAAPDNAMNIQVVCENMRSYIEIIEKASHDLKILLQKHPQLLADELEHAKRILDTRYRSYEEALETHKRISAHWENVRSSQKPSSQRTPTRNTQQPPQQSQQTSQSQLSQQTRQSQQSYQTQQPLRQQQQQIRQPLQQFQQNQQVSTAPPRPRFNPPISTTIVSQARPTMSAAQSQPIMSTAHTATDGAYNIPESAHSLHQANIDVGRSVHMSDRTSRVNTSDAVIDTARTQHVLNLGTTEGIVLRDNSMPNYLTPTRQLFSPLDYTLHGQVGSPQFSPNSSPAPRRSASFGMFVPTPNRNSRLAQQNATASPSIFDLPRASRQADRLQPVTPANVSYGFTPTLRKPVTIIRYLPWLRCRRSSRLPSTVRARTGRHFMINLMHRFIATQLCPMWTS